MTKLANGRKLRRIQPSLRREGIVDQVRQCEHVTVEELSLRLGVSHETVRRDLSLLARAGRLRKYHGGATLANVHRESGFAERLVSAVHEKRAIARAAAALLLPGSTLFVDVGTTTLLFAEALHGRTDLTVITNGIDIARNLTLSGVKVFVIGGELKSQTAEMVGTLAVEQITRFFATDAVLTVAGLNDSGAMDFQLDEAQIARAMISQARSVTVIADGSKLGRDALFQICPLEIIDRVVLDRVPEPRMAHALTNAHVEVIIAESEQG